MHLRRSALRGAGVVVDANPESGAEDDLLLAVGEVQRATRIDGVFPIAEVRLNELFLAGNGFEMSDPDHSMSMP